MPDARGLSRCVIVALILLSSISLAHAQAELSPDVRTKIDKLATDALSRSGVPSASVAVVKDGKIVYLKADQDAPYGRVMAAFDALRKANVENIGLIAERKTQQGAPAQGGK